MGGIVKLSFTNEKYESSLDLQGTIEKQNIIEKNGGDSVHILGNNIPFKYEENVDPEIFKMSRGGQLFHDYEENGINPWRESAQRIFSDPYFFKNDSMWRPSTLRDRNNPVLNPHRQRVDIDIENASEEEVSEWALELVGQISNNLVYGGIHLENFNNLSDRSKLDLYRLINMYHDPEGKTGVANIWYEDEEGNYDGLAWDGLGRAFKGILSDPTTYGGGLIYKIGAKALARLSGKVGGNKAVLKIMQGLLSSTMLASVEGGVYSSAFDYQQQKFEIEGRNLNPLQYPDGRIPNEVQRNIDPVRLATAYSIGAIAGPALERGLPLIPKAGKEIKSLYERTDWSKMSSTTPAIVPPITLRLTRNENKLINDLDIPKKDKTKLRDEVKRIKGKFADSENFEPVFFKGAKISRGKDGEPKFKIEWADKDGKLPKYSYHVTPKNMTDDEYKEKIVGTIYDDVMDLLERAKAKDPEAELILAQADWYREMQNTIRKDFGGMGDVFADVLSATSAGVNVRQNFHNTMVILKKYSNGDYDKEIQAFIKHLDEGGNIGNAMPKDFPLISNDAGKLFNTNSPKATIALLGMFREIHSGKKPKTVNFLGNLLGVNPEATVDVWANRYIGKIGTGKWFPPHADVQISGAYRKDATFENPDIGSEFGFTQDMFRSATDRLNANTEFTDYMDMGKMEPRDIQAIAWFLEKNRWDKGGWTSEAGGNYSDELQFAGQTDQARVKKLRSIIGSKKTTPEDKLKAEAELDTLKADQERWVVGVSRQQDEIIPTNKEQAQLSENLTKPLKDSEMINAFQANNNLGVWKEDNKLQFERSLNMEIIAKPGWDQTDFEKTFINELQANNQWSGFIAKTLKEKNFTGYDDFPNASPGFELFIDRQDGTTDVIKEINKILADADVPFSYITDARYKDLPKTQTGSNIQTEAGVTGIRMMYIPDYDDAFDPSKASEMKLDAFLKFTEVVDKIKELGYIRTIQQLEFDLKVYNKGTDY